MFYIVPTKYSVILILFFLRQSVIWTILELNRFPQLKLQYMMTTWSLRKGSITYESTSLTNGKKKKADFKKKKTQSTYIESVAFGVVDQNCSTDISTLLT